MVRLFFFSLRATAVNHHGEGEEGMHRKREPEREGRHMHMLIDQGRRRASQSSFIMTSLLMKIILLRTIDCIVAEYVYSDGQVFTSLTSKSSSRQ